MSALLDPFPADTAAVGARAQLLHTRCGDGRMAWRRWGDGKPLVLLHGGSGSWTHWVRNIDALQADGWSPLVPDLPGFGESDPPPGSGDADGVAPVLLDGLRELLGDTPADVVGFSFGSLCAALAGAQAPGRIGRLVLVGAPALALGQPLRLRLWEHLADSAQRREVHRHNLGVLMFADPAHITDAAIDLHAANMARDRMRSRRLVRTDAMARALRALDAPVWAIYGRHDALYRDRWDDLQALLDGVPMLRSLRFVEGAGHWVQYEDPAGFQAALREALGTP